MTLAMSKARPAPIKRRSIPLLELQAAQATAHVLSMIPQLADDAIVYSVSRESLSGLLHLLLSALRHGA